MCLTERRLEDLAVQELKHQAADHGEWTPKSINMKITEASGKHGIENVFSQAGACNLSAHDNYNTTSVFPLFPPT